MEGKCAPHVITLTFPFNLMEECSMIGVSRVTLVQVVRPRDGPSSILFNPETSLFKNQSELN